MMQNFLSSDDPLNLDNVRATLIRLEDSIIFALIERAQFALNPRVYEKGAFQELIDLGFNGTLLGWFLKETESFHAKARRYTSPDEHPFTPIECLPKPILPLLEMPAILHPNKINVNPSVLSFYTRTIVPLITRRATRDFAAMSRSKGRNGGEEFEDDGNYGSSVTADLAALQLISKRVHYGKFVSESKFRSDPAAFIPHILKPDPQALEALITKPAVEKALLDRIVEKASIYGPDLGVDGKLPIQNGNHSDTKWRIDTETVRELYEDWIIPLTKEVEVDYLLRRLDGLTQEEIDLLSKSQGPEA
ncbi:chorismate mutase [Cantharellus anzutake]|uniref:chorismate mutase n=1 Tax=Cantharellus anzutake TaxID=1750568 RepID=UPI001902E304|nr:chorismate mutase [Cantharellus anzutake]XP_038918226.1 chorismate mutase [Cantharellus anzutake]KAF8324755.1 chorismate mutase [Cantharellus anzutake]KAF8334720.1 chorismate mutase [Cantharellus anzutake]